MSDTTGKLASAVARFRIAMGGSSASGAKHLRAA
jgi:hypothetical protein